MKPDWKDAPKWAKWLARSAGDDEWTWFEKKPIRDSEGDYVQQAGSRYQNTDCADPSLERRP